jgi:hypothetical protein
MNKKYKRLTGSRFTYKLGQCSFWIGKDHLLHIRISGYTETYKRFYFEDIEGFIIRKSWRRLIINIVFLSFMSAFLIMAIAAFSDGFEGGWIGFGFLALFNAVVVVVNIVKGPGCHCHIRTRVQLEELPSITRIRQANRLIALLTPIIMVAQQIYADELSNGKLSQNGTNPFSETDYRPENPAIDSPHFQPHKPRLKQYDSNVHLLLFSAMIVEAISTGLNFLVHSEMVLLIKMLIGLALTTLLIIALVKQQNTNLTKTIQGFTWAGLGYLCLTFLGGSIFGFIVSIDHPEISNNQWKLIQTIAAIEPLDSSFLTFYYSASICCALILGGLGLALLYEFNNDSGG